MSILTTSNIGRALLFSYFHICVFLSIFFIFICSILSPKKSDLLPGGKFSPQCLAQNAQFFLNIENDYLDERSMNYFDTPANKLDIVIPWLNETDPVWRYAEKSAKKGKLKKEWFPNGWSATRNDPEKWSQFLKEADIHGHWEHSKGHDLCEQYEELRFGLRSYEQNKLFEKVRTIYIIHSDFHGPPCYLRESTSDDKSKNETLHMPKLKFLKHSDIWPDTESLPSFSKNAILTAVHNIPGLAQTYLLLHDDFLLMRDFKISDFFEKIINSKTSTKSALIDSGKKCSIEGRDAAKIRNSIEDEILRQDIEREASATENLSNFSAESKRFILALEHSDSRLEDSGTTGVGWYISSMGFSARLLHDKFGYRNLVSTGPRSQHYHYAQMYYKPAMEKLKSMYRSEFARAISRKFDSESDPVIDPEALYMNFLIDAGYGVPEYSRDIVISEKMNERGESDRHYNGKTAEKYGMLKSNEKDKYPIICNGTIKIDQDPLWEKIKKKTDPLIRPSEYPIICNGTVKIDQDPLWEKIKKKERHHCRMSDEGLERMEKWLNDASNGAFRFINLQGPGFDTKWRLYPNPSDGKTAKRIDGMVKKFFRNNFPHKGIFEISDVRSFDEVG